jgi:septum formation protein
MTGGAGTTALILASASPRRLDLLRQIGLVPAAVDPAHIDESARPRELPADYAKRIALAKLDEVAKRHGRCKFILAADTVVACGRRILPKTEDAVAARTCLELLSGRRHRVLGGIALQAPDGKRLTRLVSTTVAFKRLSRAEVERYIESGEWHGKAGGYAVQGKAAAFVSFINGSYSNVVGLSLYDVTAMLGGFGVEI